MPLPELPLEVCDMIFAEAACAFAEFDKPVLAQLALVSRHVYAIVTPLLYETITSHCDGSHGDNKCFAAAAGHLARYTRRLSLVSSTNGWMPVTSGITLPSLVHLRALCGSYSELSLLPDPTALPPSLTCLIMSGVSLPHVFPYMHTQSCAWITHMRLEVTPNGVPLDANAVARWTALRFLVIRVSHSELFLNDETLANAVANECAPLHTRKNMNLPSLERLVFAAHDTPEIDTFEERLRIEGHNECLYLSWKEEPASSVFDESQWTMGRQLCVPET